MKRMKPRISVLIATYNEEKNIGPCLKSLKNQSYKDFEIVVSDAHSKDKTVQIAEKYADKIVFSDKTMIGIQKNKGMKACTGDYVILSDADCTHPRDWVERMVKFITKNKDVDVYGGTDVPKKSANLFERAVFAFDKEDSTIKDSEKAAWRLRGCNIIYRKKAFLDAGGYDKRLSGSEEPELHTRMAKKGFKLYFDHTLFVYHRRRDNFKDYFKQLFRNGISSGKIFRARRDMLTTADFIAIAYVLYLILSVVILFVKHLLGIVILITAFLPLLYYSINAARKSRMYHFELLIPIIFLKVFAYGLGIIYGFIGGKHIQGVKF